MDAIANKLFHITRDIDCVANCFHGAIPVSTGSFCKEIGAALPARRGLTDRDDLAVGLRLRLDPPIALRIGWSHQLPVMRKDHSGVDVP